MEADRNIDVHININIHNRADTNTCAMFCLVCVIVHAGVDA